MIDREITEAEANLLLNQVLDVIVQHSNHPDMWDDYNGYFDIRNYTHGVIYEGTKLIGEDFKIKPK